MITKGNHSDCIGCKFKVGVTCMKRKSNLPVAIRFHGKKCPFRQGKK